MDSQLQQAQAGRWEVHSVILFNHRLSQLKMGASGSARGTVRF